MKKIISLLLIIAMLAALAACGTNVGTSDTDKADSDTVADSNTGNAESDSSAASGEKLKVLTLKGPTGIGMTKIMEDCENGTSKVDCDFTIASSPDEIKGNIIQGDFDIAAVPSNLAAVLYSKNPDVVRIAAINVYSVLYILENGNTINSIYDLEGKTLYATGQGSTPEYIISYLLDKYDVNCTVEYLTEHSELATKMISGEISLGMLPMPNSTTVLMKNSDFRIALDLGDLWDELEEDSDDPSTIIQGCLIVNSKLINENPEKLETFMDAYVQSVNYLHEEPETAAELVAKFEIVPSVEIANKVVKASGIVFRNDNAGFKMLKNFYNVLYSYNPASVGGAVPDSNAYYIPTKANAESTTSAE